MCTDININVKNKSGFGATSLRFLMPVYLVQDLGEMGSLFFVERCGAAHKDRRCWESNGDTECGEENPFPAGSPFPMFCWSTKAQTGTQKGLGMEGKCWQGVRGDSVQLLVCARVQLDVYISACLGTCISTCLNA